MKHSFKTINKNVNLFLHNRIFYVTVIVFNHIMDCAKGKVIIVIINVLCTCEQERGLKMRILVYKVDILSAVGTHLLSREFHICLFTHCADILSYYVSCCLQGFNEMKEKIFIPHNIL